MKQLVIIGVGGMGTDALWVANSMQEWECLGFADDNTAKGPLVAGLPLLGLVQTVRDTMPPAWFHCAIGKNEVRQRVFDNFLAGGWKPATLVHPSALLGPGVTLGDGTYVGPGCILGPNVRTGLSVVINFHVSVGHDSLLGDFSQVCPGARINGNCELGEMSFLGSNASVQPGTKIGARVTVGANSFVIKEVPDGRVVVGVPARSM